MPRPQMFWAFEIGIRHIYFLLNKHTPLGRGHWRGGPNWWQKGQFECSAATMGQSIGDENSPTLKLAPWTGATFGMWSYKIRKKCQQRQARGSTARCSPNHANAFFVQIYDNFTKLFILEYSKIWKRLKINQALDRMSLNVILIKHLVDLL
jgi:hypothetical protein